MQISVIIPVYNAEKYLNKCLDSILNQSFRDFEVVIIDDGSTDASGDICDRYAREHKRIRVLHKENQGLICARKEGVQNALGKYISFVDADDWVDDDFLETLIQTIRDNQADIVVTGCVKEKTNSREVLKNEMCDGVYDKDKLVDGIYPYMLHYSGFYEFGIMPYMWTKLFKRDILLECYQGVDTEIYDGEDVAVVYPYLLRCQKVVVYSVAKYHYRIHEQAMTAKKKEDYYENVAKLYLHLCREFSKSNYSECLMKQLDQYMRKMIWQGSPESYVEAPKYVFPFDKVPKSARIVLYAAGHVGKEYYQQIKQIDYCNVVAWVDKNRRNRVIYNKAIIGPEDIKLYEFDYIVIAVADAELRGAIKEQLLVENSAYVIL